MPAKQKDAIMKDLVKFSRGERYYKKIGKPWKRGYLLYGPPGTGKSTMIAAMANFLNYDVYDLELSMVKDNSELRSLLIETSRKAIIVIAHMHRSLDTGAWRSGIEGGSGDPKKDSKKSEGVTLSGLLKIIDGIWSAACKGEKIIVFTANHFYEFGDLTERGRMDMRIGMPYCRFEAFKVLAKNYLDVEEHERFWKIEELLKATCMLPADVAGYLMPKSDEDDKYSCLVELVKDLEAKLKEERERIAQAALESL